VRDILETLAAWDAEGLRAVWAIVVETERSTPREPGAALAVNERGDVAGSGIRFADRGVRELAGVPGDWRLFAVEGT